MSPPDFIEPGFIEETFFEGGAPASRARHVAVCRVKRVVSVALVERVVPVQRVRRVIGIPGEEGR